MPLSLDKLLTVAARIIGLVLIAAGCFYFWKFGIGPDPEDKSAAAMFGATPILYGFLMVLLSFRFEGEKRVHILSRMIGIPILFSGISLTFALVVGSL